MKVNPLTVFAFFSGGDFNRECVLLLFIEILGVYVDTQAFFNWDCDELLTKEALGRLGIAPH